MAALGHEVVGVDIDGGRSIWASPRCAITTSCSTPAVANEVVGEFTIIYLESEAGAKVLTAVVKETQRLGGPVLLVLEDVDL
jgi:hypothetical protein